MHFMRSKKLTNKKQKILSEKQKGFRDGLSYSTPQKAKKQVEMPLPSLGPIPLKKKVEFRDGMGPRLHAWVMAFPLVSLLL